MKKYLIASLLCFSFLTSAQAQSAPDLYTSATQGGSAQTEYTMESAIYAYLNRALADTSSRTIASISSPTGDDYTIYFSSKSYDLTNSQDSWYNLDSLTYYDINDVEYTWSQIKNEGVWYLDFTYKYSYPNAGSNGSVESSFTVTPEPISSALFLIGGGALLSIRRKRIQK